MICIEAFAGIGGWRQAHDRLGVHVVINAACDTDPMPGEYMPPRLAGVH